MGTLALAERSTPPAKDRAGISKGVLPLHLVFSFQAGLSNAGVAAKGRLVEFDTTAL
jgi:hypothetical protein